MGTRNESPSTGELQENVLKDEVAGYIHNISPVKNRRYFDVQIQSKEKIMIGVCFSLQKSSSLQTLVKEPH